MADDLVIRGRANPRFADPFEGGRCLPAARAERNSAVEFPAD